MKKIILFSTVFLALLGFSIHANAQQKAADMVTFSQSQYDFGRIEQGKPVYHSFEFENKLNKPVVLENVVTTCGCTTPEWEKTPVAPGKKSVIRVGYNAANEGSFNKSIQVMVKDANIPYVLKISGEVTPKSAPK